jgi:ribose-phosphate pyrophosphokinase
LGVSPAQALVKRFSDGEVRVEIQENLRGMDVYVIQSTCPPVNENLVELLVIIDAVKRASARRINAVIPYYGYGRQDEKDKPRVPIAAKVVADLLTVAGANRIMSVNLHADQIQGFFNIPVDHLLGTDVFVEDLTGRLKGDEVVVAPDAGGVERARRFAKLLNVELAIVDHRGEEDGGRGSIVGKVDRRSVMILDDMVDTGRTLMRASKGAHAAGAAAVDAFCVHALLSGNSVENLEASALRSLTVTDTIPLSELARASSKIRTVSVAPLLAEAVRQVHYEESISSLFARS